MAREKGYVPQAPSVTPLRATSMFCLQNSTPLAAGPPGGRLAVSDAFLVRRLIKKFVRFTVGRGLAPAVLLVRRLVAKIRSFPWVVVAPPPTKIEGKPLDTVLLKQRSMKIFTATEK